MRATSRQHGGGRLGARAWAGLILAVLGISGTSTFIKLAGTDPLVTAFWRLALSVLLLLPLRVWRGRNRPRIVGTRLRGYDNSGQHSSVSREQAEIRSCHGGWTSASAGETTKKHLPISTSAIHSQERGQSCHGAWTPASAGETTNEPCAPATGVLQQLRLSPVSLLAGALLAAHLALWVTSLSMTSVLSSLVFVTMNPLFVAVLSLFLFREPTSRLLWVAVAIVTAGGISIGLRSGTGANLGNLFALGGALAESLYLIVGRRASRTMDPVSYNVGVFGWAALLMGVVCVATGKPLLLLSGTSFLWLALTAILGQTVGHGLVNVSLRSFQPQFVALMLLWEPILGSLLAFLVLGDRPGPAELVGGAVILAGLALGIVASGCPAAEGPVGTEAQPL